MIARFGLVLRIDGSVQAWKRSDIAYVRVSPKGRKATTDIFMPVSVWANGDVPGLRRFLASGVRQAITAICERAREKKKIGVATDALFSDIDGAIADYLASPEEATTALR